MFKIKNQQCYPPEFRAEAVKLVTEQGLSQQAAPDRLAIPKGTVSPEVFLLGNENPMFFEDSVTAKQHVIQVRLRIAREFSTFREILSP